MPSFDMRGVKAAAYSYTNGAVTYDTPVEVGDAMTANIELQYAEGDLYAEGARAEYIKEVVGGNISIGVKYIKDAAAKLMFGQTEKSRTISETAVKSLATSAGDCGSYVGVAFYAPDKVDGATKYTAVFIHKALFGEPSNSFATKSNSITFNTPTTTGAFMADDSSDKIVKETITCDTVDAAIAWINACFGVVSGGGGT